MFDNDGCIWRAAGPREEGETFFQAKIIVDDIEIPEDNLDLVIDTEFFDPRLPFLISRSPFTYPPLYAFPVDTVQEGDLVVHIFEGLSPELPDVVQECIDRRVRDDYQA